MSTATGPQTPPPAPGAGEPTAEQQSAPAPARRGRGTWVDMLRSLVVVLAFVGLIVLLVPRPGQLPRPAVDVAAAATGVDTQLGFPPALPTGLPAGWVPNSAETRNGADGVQTFHVGYTLDDGAIYAGVEQAKTLTKNWLAANDAGGSPVGPVTIDGVTWQQFASEQQQYTSLLLERPDRVVLVTTKKGGIATATILARALHLPPA